MITYVVKLKQVGSLPDLDHEIWYQSFYGTQDPINPYIFTEQSGVLNGPNMIPQFPAIIGEPGLVKNLSEYTTGNIDELLPPPGGGGQTVLIKGPIDIDVSYIFGGGSEIFVDDDVPLRILPERVLTLKDDTRVSGCIQTWEGIEVLENASLKVDGSSRPATPAVVTIEDADVAVTLNDGSALLCKKADFFNNFTGIYVKPNATGLNSINLQLQDANFEVMALKPPYTPSQPGNAGVILNDLGLVVIGRNSYKNMIYGIQARNTNLLTTQDYFENIGKVGIDAVGNGQVLWQTGKGNDPANPNFLNCNTGINTDNIHVLAVQNNAMQKVFTGVSIDGGSALSRDYAVFNNDIQASDLGIWLKDVRTRNFGRIYQNSVSVSGNLQNGTAIRGDNLKGIKGGNLTDTRWYQNTIDLEAAIKGISVQYSGFLNITENEISFSDVSPKSGIYITDASESILSCNVVQGASGSGTQLGIEVSHLRSTDIACNTLSQLRQCIQFNGINMLENRIKGNSLTDFNSGFQYGYLNVDGAITGKQFFTGNRWLSSPGTGGYGLIHWGSSFQTSSSQLSVDADGEPGDEPWYSSTEYTTSGIPMILIGQGDNYQCAAEYNGCPPAIPPGQNDYVTELDIAIARGTSFTNTYPQAQSWMARRMLHRKLISNPDLATSGSVVDSFLQVGAGSSEAAFEILSRDLEQALAMDSTSAANLADARDSLQELAYLITSLDSLILISSDSAEVDSLFDIRDSLVAKSAVWAVQIDSLEKSWTQNVRATAYNLQAVNAAIQDTAVYESNQKTVNAIWLDMLAEGRSNPDSAEASILSGIAGQCPLSGGLAVFQARALLGNGAVYDDQVLCAPAQPIKLPPSTDHELEVSTHPNPASEFLVVAFGKPLPEGSIVLFDLMGRQVLRESFTDESQQLVLDVSRLPSGIYLLWVSGGSSQLTRTISISK